MSCILCDFCMMTKLTIPPLLSSFIASRRAMILLIETRKLLKAQRHSYTKQIEILQRNVTKSKGDESTLHSILSNQSCTIDEVVKLVQDNEETLDLIRVSLKREIFLSMFEIAFPSTYVHAHFSPQTLHTIHIKHRRIYVNK